MNNNIEERRVSFPVAKLLKEAGFDCFTNTWRQHGDGISGDVQGKIDRYNSKGDIYTSLPTQQMSRDWIADNFGLYVYCECDVDGNYYPHISICKEEIWQDLELRLKVVNAFREINFYNTLKEATDAALEYTLTHLILKK